jgi:hypothetical protein
VYLLALGGFVAALGLAILKYRLYDIDVVINRTVLYGTLAATITALYVAIVAALGALIGSGGCANLAVSLIATALVAVAFQPLRQRLEYFANRLVYGRRATPYQALAEFSRRTAGALSVDDILPRMAAAAAYGVGAARSRVRV